MTEHIFNFFTVHFHFNSHPHEEDDLLLHWNIVFFHISTHILTRRMTNKDDTLDTLFNISTHILTRRMTAIVIPFMRGEDISTHILTRRMTHIFAGYGITLIFQLTSSRGGWPPEMAAFSFWSEISTHILTRRMTKRLLHGRIFFHISTHILTRRMTWPNTYLVYIISISTHILTRRMTYFFYIKLIICRYFNSHPHEEDDIFWYLSR